MNTLIEKLIAEHRCGPLRRLLRAQHLARAAVVLQHERNPCSGEGDAAEHFVAMAELGRLGAQELAPRRRIEIEIRYADRGALRARRGLYLANLRAFGGNLGRVRCLARAAADGEPRHRRDRGERLAAKSHGGDALEILEARDLARGVARE